MNVGFFYLLYSHIFAGSTTVGLGQELLSSKFPLVKARGMEGRVTTCQKCPARAGEPLLRSKIELFESLHQPTGSHLHILIEQHLVQKTLPP